MAKILVVDDDQALCLLVQRALICEHHTAEVAFDGQAAIDRLLGTFYDLVILDLSLPILNGIEVCRLYRKSGGRALVLMLTGRSHIDEKTSAYNTGADDYVTKPFSLQELILRVGALLRRPPASADQEIRIGRLLLNLTRRAVKLDDCKLNLSPTDYNLLEFLMRNPNHIYSADELIERVWKKENEIGDYAVRSSIKRLRKSIDDSEGKILENIKLQGYRLNS